MILQADARAIPLDDATVDAIVTDPPYGLEFMGKEWDAPHKARIRERVDGRTNPRDGKSTTRTPEAYVAGAAFQEWATEWAIEALRVAKPGCHLLAFGGTRTHHRLMCALEDAGWEIRDCLMWLYGSGFPKSLDVSKAIDKALFTTKTANPDFQVVRAWVREKVKAKGLTYRQIDAALGNENSHKASHYLDNSQPQLPTPEDWQIIKGLLQLDDSNDLDRPPKLLVETFEREIIGYRKVHRGVAFTSEGPDELPITKPMCADSEQWQGWGTALKPAWEPIILARKPLDGTVAQNVQKWGTGALNIDGGRIGTDGGSTIPSGMDRYNARLHERGYRPYPYQKGTPEPPIPQGRFPANLILDEEAGAMLDEQSGMLQSGKAPVTGFIRNSDKHRTAYAPFAGNREEPTVLHGDSGGASRFFYCAKASRSERGEGNDHPTVKPVALMRYLCRLVTPPGGLILDLFMGSGSTRLAARVEFFRFIGMDKDGESCRMAIERMIQEVLPLA